MTDIAAVGPLSTPIEQLKNMLTISEPFATEALESTGGTGPFSALDADHVIAVKSRIHYYANEKEYETSVDSLEMPYAVLMTSFGFRRIGITDCFPMVVHGSCDLILVRESDYKDDSNNSFLSFTNFVGPILSEIAAKSGGGTGQAAFTDISITDHITRTQLEDRTEDGVFDFWCLRLKLDYGL